MSLTVLKPCIAAEPALDLVRWCIDHARREGWSICAAVCDPAGHLMAFHRMDGTSVPPIGFAIDKAYTAATMERATADLFTRAEGRPALKQGLTNRDRILVFPGGFPIRHDGRVIGGLGVSGALDFQDVECAEAALARLGLRIGERSL